MTGESPEIETPKAEPVVDMPLLRIESSSAPVLYVLVHHLLEGQVPGVPMPEGLLERARAAGRLA